MIALFFEVLPRPGLDDRYLEIAASLGAELAASGGILFIDRYRSTQRPRVLLSHQIWADEASLARWRANGRHHGAQTAGRNGVFEDYRLRIGPVIAEGRRDGSVVETTDGLAYNDPVRQPERWMVVVRSAAAPYEIPGGEIFRSVYREGELASVATVQDRTQGLELLRRAAAIECVSAAQLCLVSRDYGLLDRREAPQYFPPMRVA